MRACRNSISIFAFLVAAVFGVGKDMGAQAKSTPAPSQLNWHRLIADPDPASVCYFADLALFDELVHAIYEGTRAQRVLAIDVAGCEGQPVAVLPYLAALMGARERQVAARAAAALTRHINQLWSAPDTDLAETVPGQLEALGSQVWSVATDPSLDVDIRVSAIAAVHHLFTQEHLDKTDLSDLLKESDPAIRGAALAALLPPIQERYLPLLAEMAADDTDLQLKGQAAALLCENARAHGVSEPSKDLSHILRAILGNAEMPADSIGPILGCLNRFSVAARADLIDVALGHPDKSVSNYWDLLQHQSRYGNGSRPTSTSR
ncbi:MAG: HEAT repeat domain-containing protein [Myxococcota bacterium]|nr:HEAT repeat domain-containing protein [Myxococcota bacterium]